MKDLIFWMGHQEPLSVDVWLDGLRSYGFVPGGSASSTRETNEGIADDGIAIGPVRSGPLEGDPVQLG